MDDKEQERKLKKNIAKNTVRKKESVTYSHRQRDKDVKYIGRAWEWKERKKGTEEERERKKRHTEKKDINIKKENK